MGLIMDLEKIANKLAFQQNLAIKLADEETPEEEAMEEAGVSDVEIDPQTVEDRIQDILENSVDSLDEAEEISGELFIIELMK